MKIINELLKFFLGQISKPSYILKLCKLSSACSFNDGLLTVVFLIYAP